MSIPTHTPMVSSAPQVLFSENCVMLSGDWTLQSLRPELVEKRGQLSAFATHSRWNLSAVERLDALGALLLWRAWGEKHPEHLVLPERLKNAFARIEHLPDEKAPKRHRLQRALRYVASLSQNFSAHIMDLIRLLGQLCLELLRLPSHPNELPVREFSAAFYKAGVQALPISALLGFLIGIVLSFLSSLQLQNFGAENFLVNILGLGVIRELGPVLVSILVAGRSGSAITAQIGVMRVTEEIEALAAMGVSRYQRLILPKVLALSCTLPLLVAWTSAMALLGGSVAAKMQLNLDIQSFLERLPSVVPIANLMIGLSKGAVFGWAIAMIACHFGLRVKPNTESLSSNTTASVVCSITAVIFLDAIFAIVTRTVGVPR